MKQPGPRPGEDRETEASRTSASPGAPRGSAEADDGEPDELPEPVEEFLERLSKALQQHAFYPADHPALEPVLDEVVVALDDLLDGDERLTVGVATDRLVTEDGESDPDHTLLRSLATRLHEHEMARVTFLADADAEELSDFLGEVSARPEADAEPVAGRRDVTDRWSHVLVEPIRYEELSMADELEDVPLEEIEEGRARELWIGLARAALAEEVEALAADGEPDIDTPTEELTDEDLPAAGTIVAALEGISARDVRARAVAARLLAVAERLNLQTGGEEEDEVRARFRRLMGDLSAGARGRLLQAAPERNRQAFLQATVDWLPPDQVLDLVEQMADQNDLGISYHMLNLLSKLATHVGVMEEARDPEAENAFRDQVRNLVSGWRRNIEAPDGEAAGPKLPGSPTGPGDDLFGGVVEVDPHRVVQTALEVDVLGIAGDTAVDEILDAGHVGRVLEYLRNAPPGETARNEIWRRIDASIAVRELLRREPPDFAGLDDLLDRLGAAAAGPLLDALSDSASRSTRRKLFSRLADLSGAIEEEILRRLEDERWYVKRNMLALLSERGTWPEAFTALPYTRHSRAAVRREAYKLAFTSDEEREEALRRALRDPDAKAVSLAIALVEDTDDSAIDPLVPLIRDRLEKEGLSPDLLRPAVRALGRARSREALRALLDFARTRNFWTFWRMSIARKSPLVLASLEALSDGWADHPEARDTLQRARDSSDPEIREAAR